jgi:hypothetical protein
MIEVELLEGIVGSYVGSYVVFIFHLAESAHPFCGALSIPSQGYSICQLVADYSALRTSA